MAEHALLPATILDATQEGPHQLPNYVVNLQRHMEKRRSHKHPIYWHQGTFPSVILNWLIHDMRNLRSTNAIHRLDPLESCSRRTSITFMDMHQNQNAIERPRPRMPLSGIASSNSICWLIDICNKKSGEDVVAFVDDTTPAQGKNLEITNNKSKIWWREMEVHSPGPKHTNVTLPSKNLASWAWPEREKPTGHPVTCQIVRKPVSIQNNVLVIANTNSSVSYLIKTEMNSHATTPLPKHKVITQYWWLATPTKGTSAKHMRRFYITIAIPHILYTAWLSSLCSMESPWIQGPHKEIGESKHRPLSMQPEP